MLYELPRTTQHNRRDNHWRDLTDRILREVNRRPIVYPSGFLTKPV